MRILFLKIVTVLVLITVLAGCSEKRSAKTSVVVKHNFYYYPHANVYFDSTDSSYSYLENNAEAWKVDKEIPDSLKSLLDKKVLIENPDSPVWKNNEQDRVVYAASLYAMPSDFKQNPPKRDSSEKKATKKIEKDIQPHESAFKKFFKKIFAKKKKDTIQ